jgi:hypothetical protein
LFVALLHAIEPRRAVELVTVELTRPLRAAYRCPAEQASPGDSGTACGLGEAPLLEAGDTFDLPGLVVSALGGR